MNFVGNIVRAWVSCFVFQFVFVVYGIGYEFYSIGFYWILFYFVFPVLIVLVELPFWFFFRRWRCYVGPIMSWMVVLLVFYFNVDGSLFLDLSDSLSAVNAAGISAVLVSFAMCRIFEIKRVGSA